jgi:monoamine oxidase
VTYHHKVPGVGAVQWEIGAGRISIYHRKTISLLQRYHLTTIPIKNQSDYLIEMKQMRNHFFELREIYLTPLRSLSKEVLQTNTLSEVLTMIHGKEKAQRFVSMFPYYSEMHVMRADAALAAFREEMGETHRFVACKEGLSALMEGMRDEFLHLGGEIQYGKEVQGIHSIEGGYEITVKKQEPIHTKLCVMALHRDAVAHIHGLSTLPVLSKLRMMPLYRMYAVFDRPWFSDLPKIVTPGPIRYFIPMSSKTVMISYTDGKDALYWMKQSPRETERNVMKEIRRLFPARTIPDPVFFKMHPWESGCTYWLPGAYSVEEESKKSLQPLPDSMHGVFLCGESFAIQPCWIESALLQADRLLAHPAFRAMISSL